MPYSYQSGQIACRTNLKFARRRFVCVVKKEQASKRHSGRLWTTRNIAFCTGSSLFLSPTHDPAETTPRWNENSMTCTARFVLEQDDQGPRVEGPGSPKPSQANHSPWHRPTHQRRKVEDAEAAGGEAAATTSRRRPTGTKRQLRAVAPVAKTSTRLCERAKTSGKSSVQMTTRSAFKEHVHSFGLHTSSYLYWLWFQKALRWMPVSQQPVQLKLCRRG